MRNIKLIHQITLLSFVVALSILGLSIATLPYIAEWQKLFMYILKNEPFKFYFTGMIFIGMSILTLLILIILRKESYLTLWVGDNPVSLSNKLINKHIDIFCTKELSKLKWSHSSKIKRNKINIYLKINLDNVDDHAIFLEHLQNNLKSYLSEQIQYRQPFYLHIIIS